jgi:hypothetical protein
MKKYAFTAKIQAVGRGGACVLFPFSVEKEFSTRGRVPVQVTFDGVPYRGSLTCCGASAHMVGMLKSIRAEIGKEPGDLVDVELWKDEAERSVDVPPELAKLMQREGLRVRFDALSLTHRKEYCRWITDAKKEETRARRLRQAVEMLRAGVKTPD